MKKISFLLIMMAMVAWLSACTKAGEEHSQEETVLVYGSGDYTGINPAMDEHGEINILLFNGLTAHNGKNEVIPALAKSWDFDEENSD